MTENNVKFCSHIFGGKESEVNALTGSDVDPSSIVTILDDSPRKDIERIDSIPVVLTYEISFSTVNSQLWLSNYMIRKKRYGNNFLLPFIKNI